MSEVLFFHFGSKPNASCSSPLEQGDHPELDSAPLLDQDGAQQHQSMVGALQWAASLGRLDIAAAVTPMSSFRVEPREGHMEQLKRMRGCLLCFKYAAIRIKPNEPGISDIPEKVHDWEESVNRKVSEVLPADAPEFWGNLW